MGVSHVTCNRVYQVLSHEYLQHMIYVRAYLKRRGTRSCTDGETWIVSMQEKSVCSMNQRV